MFTIKMIVRFFFNIYEETSISLILAISDLSFVSFLS